MQGGIDSLCSHLPSRRRRRVYGPFVAMPADGVDVMFALAFAAVRPAVVRLLMAVTCGF